MSFDFSRPQITTDGLQLNPTPYTLDFNLGGHANKFDSAAVRHLDGQVGTITPVQILAGHLDINDNQPIIGTEDERLGEIVKLTLDADLRLIPTDNSHCAASVINTDHRFRGHRQ